MAVKASRRLSLHRRPEADEEGRRGQKRPLASSTEESGPKEPESWRSLMDVGLPPRRREDNYEISEKDENSDAEEPDRSHKYVPPWGKNYLQLLAQQQDTDPDTIFGCRMPKVDLDAIFRDEDYKDVRQKPKRRRGSSGNWGQDRLSRTEVEEYKTKMGQVKRYSMASGSVAIS